VNPQSIIRVLVVEDHILTAKGLIDALGQSTNCQVVGFATTHAQAHAMAMDLRPDLVVLDLHLPDCDNPRLLLKDFCLNQPWKVLVFSGENRPSFIQLVMKHGASGYLLKSADAEKVIRSIQAICAGFSPVLSPDLIDAPDFSSAQDHILHMLAQGLRYEQMAAVRKTSVSTLKKQCITLQLKLSLNTREELIAWASRNGYGNIH
jgi:two-component system response regulator NreC